MTRNRKIVIFLVNFISPALIGSITFYFNPPLPNPGLIAIERHKQHQLKGNYELETANRSFNET